VAAQSWAAAQGYPAPQVLTVLAPGEAVPSPVQVMVRAPGVPLIAASGPPPDTRPGKVPDNRLRLARRLTESGSSGQPASAVSSAVSHGRLQV
jgi:hypothetical protein